MSRGGTEDAWACPRPPRALAVPSTYGARRGPCDSTPIAISGLLSTQFETVDGNVIATTSPDHRTVGHGDVKAQRKLMTRVVDYPNRLPAAVHVDQPAQHAARGRRVRRRRPHRAHV